MHQIHSLRAVRVCLRHARACVSACEAFTPIIDHITSYPVTLCWLTTQYTDLYIGRLAAFKIRFPDPPVVGVKFII